MPALQGDGASYEQAYLDRAYELLGEMESRASAAAADAAERAPGDWDATIAHRFLSQRVASMSASAGPLCFGRIGTEHREAWHIGRRHVEDGLGEPVVVDWRAPVSIPFYRATFRDPLGLERRRRFILDERQLADIVDEDFHELSVGYRVPAEIMEVANHVLRATSPALRPTMSVRSAGRQPLWLECGPDEVAASVASLAATLVDQRHSVAVIASAPIHEQLEAALQAAGLPLVPYGHASLAGYVALVLPELAKGLEFDAVIVAEPALILGEPGGAGLLYIALTRAVQCLAVLFSGEVPDVLVAAAA